MTYKIIKTEGDYQNALSRIDELMDAEPNTPEGDELELLVTLVEIYEEKKYPIDIPGSVEAIKFRPEEISDVVIHSTLESGEDILIKDQWKREYHFKLATFELPPGLIAEAIEVKKDILQGYCFKMMFDFDTDPKIAKEQLMKKIKRGLNRRHLKKRDGRWRIGNKQILRGRIEWNDDFEDTVYDRIFIIDGKRITMEKFGQMFEEWEGWHFEFKILDPYDKRT